MAQVKIYDQNGKSMIAQEYNGEYFPYPFAPGDIAENLAAMKRMPTREDDVLLTAYPKSGTHWLIHTLHMLTNKTTEYFSHDYPSGTGGTDGVPILEYMDINEVQSMPSPRLLICHLRPEYIPSNFKGRIVNLSRNPKDVAVSYYSFIKGLKPLEYDGDWEDFIPMFLKGNVIWGSWFEYTAKWRNLLTDNPQYRIHSVAYEDLHQDFMQNLKKIASFLEMDVDDTLLSNICEKCKIENIRQSRIENSDPTRINFVKNAEEHQTKDIMYRKGVVGDWKSWFTVSQNEMFDKVLTESGLL